MLAGIGLSDFILPNIENIITHTGDEKRDWTFSMVGSRAVRVVLGYVLFSALIGSFSYDISLARYVVPVNSHKAMSWIQNNTPSNGRFIVLTGSGDPFSDPITEWFPAFTSRISENTIQGKEWLLGSDFMPFLNQIELLQSCLNDTATCVEHWAETNRITFDYIYIDKSINPSIPSLLSFELRQDPQYTQIYENETVVIFGRK